jgi:hypothetical protein
MQRACCDLLNQFFQRQSMAAKWQTSQEIGSAALPILPTLVFALL